MEAVDESENLLVDCALEQLSRFASHSVLNCCLGLSHITRDGRESFCQKIQTPGSFFSFFLGCCMFSPSLAWFQVGLHSPSTVPGLCLKPAP